MLYTDIGNSIIMLSSKIPNGVLIVFSSYPVLKRCLQAWHSPETNLFKRINDVKPIFEEPKLSSELETLMFNYKNACKTKKGAILLAVCRGKIRSV
jgi:Rad3-related DNA helicase